MRNIMQEMPEGKAKSQLTNELLKVQGVRRFQLVNELANITMNAYSLEDLKMSFNFKLKFFSF